MKHKIFANYQNDSGDWYREIPVHWRANRAKWVFKSIREPSHQDDVQLAASQKYGVIPQKLMMEMNNASVMQAIKGTENFKKVKKNDFVISLRSFEGGIEISHYDGCISPAYTVLRLSDSEIFHPEYFRYVLKEDVFIQALNSTSEGIRDGKTITFGQFSALNLCFPSIDEQIEVVSFLNIEIKRLERLVQEKQNFIKLLKEKRQALISHVVTKGLDPDVEMKDSGVEWIGEIPKHWNAVRIRYISKGVTTGGTPKNEDSFCDEGGIPWFSPGDFKRELALKKSKKKVTENAVQLKDVKIYPANSVLVVGIGATLGKIGYSEKDFSCNQQVNIIIPDNRKVLVKYLSFALSVQVEQMKISSNTSTIGIMNQEKTKGIKIAIPCLKEQNKIIDFIEKKVTNIDSLVNEVAISLELLKERRTALISAAVTGKIDLRDKEVA
jgi:type I restriction enzyme S subunit